MKILTRKSFLKIQLIFFGFLIFTTTQSNLYAQCIGPANDCDNDGIINSVDLDDDNDGILDTEECTSSFDDFIPLGQPTADSGNTGNGLEALAGGTAVVNDIYL